MHTTDHTQLPTQPPTEPRPVRIDREMTKAMPAACQAIDFVVHIELFDACLISLALCKEFNCDMTIDPLLY